MSYILDALRKSDQQRKRGAAPRLQTVQAAAAVRKQPAFLLYGLSAAILLGGGIAIGWWHPWQTELPASIGGSLAAKPLELSPPQATAPALPPVLPEMASKPAQEIPVQQMPVRQSRSASLPPPAPAAVARERHVPAVARVETNSTRREAATAAPKDEAQPVREKPFGGAPAQSVKDQKFVVMSDLPPSIQQEIPAMSISVHAYSPNPKDRLVSINNRMLREGDYLQPGLGLEQITPDGMIFSYKGYRFLRGVR